MILLLLFFSQVSAQKTECIFCSAKFIDGIGIIDGDASCFEGFFLMFFLVYIEKIKEPRNLTQLGEQFAGLKSQSILGIMSLMFT